MLSINLGFSLILYTARPRSCYYSRFITQLNIIGSNNYQFEKKRKTLVSVLSIDNQLMMKKKDDDKHAWVFILYENQLITWVQWKTKQKKQNKLVDHLCWGFSFFRSISCYKVYTRPIHFYFLVDTHENNEIDLMTSTLFYYRESKGEGSRKIYPNSPGVKHFFSPLYLIKV